MGLACTAQIAKDVTDIIINGLVGEMHHAGYIFVSLTFDNKTQDYNIGLTGVIFELVEDIEKQIINVAGRLRFVRSKPPDNFVEDADGRTHDLLLIDLALGIWTYWWAF